MPEAERHDSAIQRNREALAAELKLWEGYLKVTPEHSWKLTFNINSFASALLLITLFSGHQVSQKFQSINECDSKVCTNIWPLTLLCFVGQWRLPGGKNFLSGRRGRLSQHRLCLPFWVEASISRAVAEICFV